MKLGTVPIPGSNDWIYVTNGGGGKASWEDASGKRWATFNLTMVRVKGWHRLVGRLIACVLLARAIVHPLPPSESPRGDC